MWASLNSKWGIVLQKNRFGRTGLQISRIVMGTGNVGGLFTDSGKGTEQFSVVKQGLSAGINWIDTAPQYGDKNSERNLGKVLRQMDEIPHVSTKVRLEQEDLGNIPAAIERSLRSSLERLQLNKVALLQLHNDLSDQPGKRNLAVHHIFREGGVLEGMENVRQLGLTDYIGFTAKGQSEACLEVARSGMFDTAQVYYNLLNPSAGQDMPKKWTGQDFQNLIGACQSHDMGVMAIRVLAAGVLASDNRTGRESVLTENTCLDEEERKAQALFQTLHSRRSQVHLALQFALSHEGVSCAIVGISETKHLSEAVAALTAPPLDAHEFEQLRRLYESDFRS